jgi:plasmid stabilization system protein ParE
MNYSFHPEAEKEFIEAIDYYEDIELGLGYDFAGEVYLSIQRALEFPEAWTKMEDEIRRSMVNRFPFGVLYSIEADEIFILAIMHLHKRPGYWKSRK